MAAVSPKEHAPPSSGRIANWFVRHAKTGSAALKRLTRQPFASLMTVLVIAVTLALPSAMHLVVKNAQSVSASWDNALDFSVYLRNDTSTDDARRLADIIRQRADVERVILITPDEALEEFRAHSGFGESLDHLTVNPLPHTLVVRPGSNHNEASMKLLNEELGNLPETDFVQVDTDWVRRFHAILEILERSIALGSALLAAAIVVIIGNTIRLDIQNRRDEIEVVKLIGASNAFVRRPFLYSGLWYGLGGGLLALILVRYGLIALEGPVARLAGLYSKPFAILALDFRESLAIVGAGMTLGLAGSWLAAARHMRRSEPR
ncbi:MAG: permease-like cell division protein FtsX [Woeseiaceae bacterium]|nr:permease-like cell division protein FtsX [Woeseiaceae bacterium]